MTAPVIESHPQSLEALTVALDDVVRQVMRPKPKLTGSEWANKYRILPAETATEAGPYRWERAPYQKEWLDVMCDGHTQKVVLMTAARVGKTTCLENTMGYFMSQNPSAILWQLPTLGEADKFSVNNIDPMIRDCRVLRELVKDKRRRDSGNLKLQKRYKGGHLTLVGAESATQLHGKTIKVLLADEVDRFPFSAGTDGDPLTLATVRTTTFGARRKVVISSTPTYKDLSHIEREFNESDQRHYHVPCPDCGHYQKLTWKNLNFTDDEEHPVYVCEGCGYCIPEAQKFNMLTKGKWVAENPTSLVVGFHINALYSVYMTWKEMVKEWRQAKNNRFKLQVFINSRLAETWDESGDRVSAHQLEQRMEHYNAPCPTKADTCNGVGIITAGVDIQGNRIEVAMWGHGANDELWLLDSEIVEGDTSTDKPWQDLTTMLFRKRYRTVNGGTIGIRSIAIDSGFNTERVYRYVAYLRTVDTAGRTIIATKGVERYPRLIADRPSQSKTANALFYQIGTDIAKEHLSKLLANTNVGENYIHIPLAFPTEDPIPRWLDREILAQLTSEKPVLTYKNGKPKREWRKTRERNEQWDMMILAYAALLHLGGKILQDMPTLVQRVGDLKGTAIAPSDTPPKTSDTPSALKKAGIRIHSPRNGVLSRNQQIWQR